MKKIISVLTLMLCGALCACTNNPTPSDAATTAPTATPSDVATPVPTATPTGENKFLNLGDCGIERVTVECNESTYTYAFCRNKSYTGKKITDIEITTYTFDYDDPDYTVLPLDTVDGSLDAILVVTLNGDFEDGDEYSSLMELTVTYEDGTTAHIEDVTSIELNYTR